MLNVRWADGSVDTYLATTTTAGKAGARCQPAENKASRNSGRWSLMSDARDVKPEMDCG